MKRLATLATAALALSACSEDTLGPGNLPAGERAVSLSFGTPSTASPTPVISALMDTIVVGSDELVLESVRFVLREIELERVEAFDCLEEDDCEEIEVGPMLVDLPLDGSIQQSIAVVVDTGSYDEIEFELHKPDDDNQADLDFIAQHPEFADQSIRVTGTFNGQPFVFESDVNVEQEQDLANPLVIDSLTTQTNLTLLVDVGVWFVDETGGLVDPSTANKGGVNEGLVKDNIKDSFEAFEDHDSDGHESDSDDDDPLDDSSDDS